MTMRGNPQHGGTDRGEAGFTLVELLVVMLILALLAVIAIPAFFNQRDKAHDADAKQDARTAETAIEAYATENEGSYVGATELKLIEIEPTLTGAALTVGPVGPSSYTLGTLSDTGVTYTIERLGTGATVFDCAPRGQGGCQAGGTGW